MLSTKTEFCFLNHILLMWLRTSASSRPLGIPQNRDFSRQKGLAGELTDTPEQLICQEDTFFNVLPGKAVNLVERLFLCPSNEIPFVFGKVLQSTLY